MKAHAAASLQMSFKLFHPHRLLSAVLIAVLFGCTEPPPDFELSSQASLAPNWHMVDSTAQTFCTNQLWDTCPAWISTDDQRLNAGNGTYGPVAFIVPAQDLATKAGPGAFTNLEAVAGILVAAPAGTVLPYTYNELQLSPGMNCVYMRSSPNWEAYVMLPAQNGMPCPPNPQPTGPALEVRVVSTPGHNGFADVPAVARFHEGVRRGRNTPQPFFGVKCGASWCMILPVGADSTEVPHKDKVPNERRWLVRGWHDAQHLGVASGNPPVLRLSPEIVGTAAPGPAAEFNDLKDFEDGFVRAVTVHFREDPTDPKYRDDWAFQKGENQIWLAKEPNADKWAGRIRRPVWYCKILPGMKRCYKDLHAYRVDHNKKDLPATARFRWDELDEGAWVRCDDGCCRISPS